MPFLRQAFCGCRDIRENMEQVPAYSEYDYETQLKSTGKVDFY